jgi:hypothetical protein
MLFFDNTGMSATDQADVRQAATRLIDANAEPSLLTAVDFDGGFRVTQSFTENAGRLREAVRGVKFTRVESGGTRESRAAIGLAGCRQRSRPDAVDRESRPKSECLAGPQDRRSVHRWWPLRPHPRPRRPI